MQIAMVGLGRMGANMVRRLLRAGHDCIAYDVNDGVDDAGNPTLRAVAPTKYAPLIATLNLSS